MVKHISRNAPCYCGSGQKYKNCHGKKSTGGTISSRWIYLMGAAVVAGAVIIVVRASEVQPGAAPPGKVWSPEHGHWHDVAPVQQQNNTPSPQLPGPAPPSKVWSPEHGHWHDALPAQQQDGPPFVQPPGPIPEGKVWSSEHGHWHDASPN